MKNKMNITDKFLKIHLTELVGFSLNQFTEEELLEQDNILECIEDYILQYIGFSYIQNEYEELELDIVIDNIYSEIDYLNNSFNR